MDLRHVNFFVKESKIKFEDAKSHLAHGLVRLILSRAIIILRYLNLINNFWVSHGCWMASLNISSLQFYRLDSLWDHIFFPKLCDL